MLPLGTLPMLAINRSEFPKVAIGKMMFNCIAMKVQFKIYPFYLILFFVGGIGCSHSSDSGTRILRTGTTTAGRNFSVIEETDPERINILIEDEDAVSLTPVGQGFVVHPETIQVFEYPGETSLVHIDWDGDSSSSQDYRHQRNYYLVFQAGNAHTLLIRGNNTLSFSNEMTPETGIGAYQMAYEGGTLTIIEHEQRFDQTDVCYAEEKFLTREFEVTGSLVQLHFCEEEYRTATLVLSTNCEGLDEALQNAPWALADLPDNIRAQKCTALR